jgi:hypothetical protein
MANSNKPVARVQLYPVTGSIWKNQTQKGAFYSVSFERSYKDETGKFQTSSTFNATDLLVLAKVADLCDTKIRELRAADRQPDQADEEAA